MRDGEGGRKGDGLVRGLAACLPGPVLKLRHYHATPRFVGASRSGELKRVLTIKERMQRRLTVLAIYCTDRELSHSQDATPDTPVLYCTTSFAAFACGAILAISKAS